MSGGFFSCCVSGTMWNLVLTVCLLYLGCDALKVSCKDYNGGEVDWWGDARTSRKTSNSSKIWCREIWSVPTEFLFLFILRYILYKSPKIGGLNGRKFIYIDPKGMKELEDISKSESVLGHTLKPILKPITSMVRTSVCSPGLVLQTSETSNWSHPRLKACSCVEMKLLLYVLTLQLHHIVNIT